MKKGYIILAVFLLASLAGTYFILIRFVLPMQQELATHQAEAAALRTKIKSLEVTFNKTDPVAVIQAMQRSKQPWVNASKTRTSDFRIEELPEIEMPDDVIPRFWYDEEYPKIEDALYARAAENRIRLGSIDFDINPPSFYDGKNPTREEILEEINKYQYGVAMTEFIFDAKPIEVNNVYIWPMKSVNKGKSGEILTRTIGYSIEIRYLELLKFLQKLNLSDTYITVEGIKIVKTNLLAPKGIMTVELLITDGDFAPNKATGAGQEIGQISPIGSGLLQSVFGNRSANNANSDEDEPEDSGGGVIGFLKGLVGLK